MPTINKIIEQVDGVKLNTFDEELKFQWLSNLDGVIARTVMQTDMPKYEYPQDMDTELLVDVPFDGIYQLYLGAQIDFHNREYEHYNNSMLMFNSAFEDFRKNYIRENRPKSAGYYKNI